MGDRYLRLFSHFSTAFAGPFSASRISTGRPVRTFAFGSNLLHSLPEDKALYCQRYMDEQICLTVDENHSFAKKKSISFAEMRGMRILVSGRIGFWMDICKKHLSESDLLIQTSSEALGELIEASTLPFFNSDRMIEMGYQTPGRVSVPIGDEDAHATYWAACRTSDQNKYRAIFNAVRSYTLRHKTRNSR